MRDNSGWNLDRRGGSDKKCSDCENILRAEPIGFVDGLSVGCERQMRQVSLQIFEESA